MVIEVVVVVKVVIVRHFVTIRAYSNYQLYNVYIYIYISSVTQTNSRKTNQM